MIVIPQSTQTTLAAAGAAYKHADKDLRKAIGAQTRKATTWVRPIVNAKARTKPDRLMTQTTRVQVTARGLKLVMGGSGRIGRIARRDLVRAYEFGGNREKRIKYWSTSQRGRRYPVRRHTQRQLPARDDNGRLLYAALPDIIPRLIGDHLRAIRDALE